MKRMSVWELLALKTLKEYRAKKVALESLMDQIAQLKSESTSLRSVAADAISVRSGGNKRDDKFLNNISWRGELEKNLKESKRDVLMVERAMSILSDEQKLILDKSYINPEKGAIERLCCDLGYEKTTVYEKREAALEQYTLAYYGAK